MKKKSILILCIICSLNLIAQTYSPLAVENRFWILKKYDLAEVAPGALSGFMYAVDGDTVVNEQSYKKMYKYDLAGSHPCETGPCFSFEIPYRITGQELYALLREDLENRIIYAIPFGNGEFCEPAEHVLFDFSLQPGDSLNDCSTQAIWGNGLVDTIRTETIYENERRTIYTTGVMTYLGLPPYGEVRISEGFGFVNHGPFHFSENRAEMYDFCEGTLESCNITYTGIQTIEKQPFITAPNPTTGVFTIHSELAIESLGLYDLSGRLLLKENSKEVNMTGFAAGVYILKITDKQGKVYSEKIIKGN